MEVAPTRENVPLSAIGDVQMNWELAGSRNDRAFDAWISFAANFNRILDVMERSEQVQPWVLDEISFVSDFSRTFREDAGIADPSYVARDARMWEQERHYYEDLGEELSTIEARIARATKTHGLRDEVMRRRSERTYSDQALLDIVEVALDERIAYLTTGDKNSFFPGTTPIGVEQAGSWDETKDLEHSFTLARRYDMANGTTYEQRINEQVAELGRLYASREYTGRALATLAILTDKTAFDRLLVDVVAMMQEVKAIDPEHYQREYSYVTRMLKVGNVPGSLRAFEAQLSAAAIPPIEGATQEFKHVGDEVWLIEKFVEENNFDGFTLTGKKATLPFNEPRTRSTMRYGTPEADVMYDAQYSVDFGDLPELAQQRVRQMQDRPTNTESLVSLSRLGFGFGEQLLTIAVPDDGEVEWYIRRWDENLNGPVKNKDVIGDVADIEHLGSDYLITAYDGSYNYMQSYSLRDFHPDMLPEGANSFWFSGPCLLVTSKEDDHFSLKKTEYGTPTSRYVITPVEFYRTTTVTTPINRSSGFPADN